MSLISKFNGRLKLRGQNGQKAKTIKRQEGVRWRGRGHNKISTCMYARQRSLVSVTRAVEAVDASKNWCVSERYRGVEQMEGWWDEVGSAIMSLAAASAAAEAAKEH